MNLTKIDIKILDLLQRDASLTAAQVAEHVNLSVSPCWRRINRLESEGLIEKIEDHRLMVPRGDRSGAVIEPLLTDQWYVKVAPLAAPAIEAVESGRTRFVPETWSKTYFEWMRNIHDWCISRQLWWGHRIPAWYCECGEVIVAREAPERCPACGVALVREGSTHHQQLAGRRTDR